MTRTDTPRTAARQTTPPTTGLEVLAKSRLVLITTETTQEAPTLGAISA